VWGRPLNSGPCCARGDLIRRAGNRNRQGTTFKFVAEEGGQRPVETGGLSMSNPTQPVPVTVVPDDRPAEVVIVSHSPLFYWWPVWAVGFLMAGLSYWQDMRMAFVPPGTVAERGIRVEGQDGPRDVLIAPAGRSLPAASETDELKQPRLRMAES